MCQLLSTIFYCVLFVESRLLVPPPQSCPRICTFINTRKGFAEARFVLLIWRVLQGVPRSIKHWSPSLPVSIAPNLPLSFSHLALGAPCHVGLISFSHLSGEENNPKCYILGSYLQYLSRWMKGALKLLQIPVSLPLPVSAFICTKA